MGYTNYWNLEKTEFPEEFLEGVKKIIDVANGSGIDLANGSGIEGTKPIVEKEVISLNGMEPEDYETFYLGGEKGFGFCKTARRPYDAVVKAILILAEQCGIVSGFSFDGNTTEQEYLTAKLLLKKANINFEESEDEKIKTLLEEKGFTVSQYEGCFEIQQYTPAGEDWLITLEWLSDIKDFADNFDPEEEFEMWVKANVSGKPRVSELWEDQLWKKELLDSIVEELSE